MQALEFLIQPARRPEVRQPKLAARVLDALAQHVERPAPGDLAREVAEEARLDVCTVVLLEPCPLLRLGSQKEVDDVGREQAEACGRSPSAGACGSRRAVGRRRRPAGVPAPMSRCHEGRRGRGEEARPRSAPQGPVRRSCGSRCVSLVCRGLVGGGTDVDLAGDRRRDQGRTELLEVFDGFTNLACQSSNSPFFASERCNDGSLRIEGRKRQFLVEKLSYSERLVAPCGAWGIDLGAALFRRSLSHSFIRVYARARSL